MVVFDQLRTADLPQDAIFVPVDLTDYGQVLDGVLGIEERSHKVDALVHLAAIPAPGIVPESRHVRQQDERDVEHRHCSQARSRQEHRLGQRDGARSVVQHSAALRSGRRELLTPARIHLIHWSRRWGSSTRVTALGPSG
jgi:hypothetical protein